MPETTAGDDAAERHAAGALVRQALAQLPRQQRAVLVLRYCEDLPAAEVASLLGCSVGTVKTHAHRGLRALRESLSHMDPFTANAENSRPVPDISQGERDATRHARQVLRAQPSGPVGNDVLTPVVFAHARALLTSHEAGATEYIDADVGNTDHILAVSHAPADILGTKR